MGEGNIYRQKRVVVVLVVVYQYQVLTDLFLQRNIRSIKVNYNVYQYSVFSNLGNNIFEIFYSSLEVEKGYFISSNTVGILPKLQSPS